MKITVLGCGNAFSHKNFNQSFLVENQGKKLLIDCGIRTPMALAHAGINVKDIDAIYVSHAHAMKMSDEMKAKLYLSHYQDFVNDDKDMFGNNCYWNGLALQDGIVNGFVEVGQEFEV